MPEDPQPSELGRIREVKAAYEEDLLNRANVVGVGIGYRHRHGEPTGEAALIVMVRRKVPRAELAPEDIIPSSIEGIPVDVREMGELDAYGPENAHGAQGGYSE